MTAECLTSTVFRSPSTLAVSVQDGPLSSAELEMLEWDTPILKQNGRVEPPDIEYEYMLTVMKMAKEQSGRLINNLNELARIARKHKQGRFSEL